METKALKTNSSSRFDEYRSWIEERWAEWRQINGLPTGGKVSYAEHRAFDAWLQFRSALTRLDPAPAEAASLAA